MMQIGGKERTVSEFKALLAGAGLEMVKLWGSEGQAPHHRIVEAKLIG